MTYWSIHLILNGPMSIWFIVSDLKNFIYYHKTWKMIDRDALEALVLDVNLNNQYHIMVYW